MAFGAWVQGTTKDAGSVTSSTLAFGSNVTAGNSLIITVRQGGTGGDAITVSDNLNGNWTKDDEFVATSAGVMSSWRFSNTAGGACTVTVGFATAQTMRFDIDEYTGNFALDSNGGKAHSNGDNTSPTSSALTTSQTCAILGRFVGGNNFNPNSVSAGSGFTLRENLVGSFGTLVASEDMGTTQVAGSYTATFSWPNTDFWGCQVLAYAQASTAATPYPIIVTTKPRRNKGQVVFRKTPPVFTPATQQPIVKPFLRRNKGQVVYHKAPPVFTAPTPAPIIKPSYHRNKGVINHQPLPPPPIIATREPIIKAFYRRNKGVVHLQTFPPVFTAPSQQPIIKPSYRRNRGQAVLVRLTPIFTPPPLSTPNPIIKAFYRRNKSQQVILHSTPVFTAPTQRPIIQLFKRRNKGVVHQQPLPPPPIVATYPPIVKPFFRRNKGQVHTQTFPPVFTPPTQRPIVKPFYRRFVGKVLQVFSLPSHAPPPVTGTVCWVIISDRPAYTADIYSKPLTTARILDRLQTNISAYNQPQTTARVTDRPQTKLPFADENR